MVIKDALKAAKIEVDRDLIFEIEPTNIKDGIKKVISKIITRRTTCFFGSIFK